MTEQQTGTTSLLARLSGWRSSLVGWLRRFADRLNSNLGLWLWALVGAALLVFIGVLVWIF